MPACEFAVRAGSERLTSEESTHRRPQPRTNDGASSLGSKCRDELVAGRRTAATSGYCAKVSLDAWFLNRSALTDLLGFSAIRIVAWIIQKVHSVGKGALQITQAVMEALGQGASSA